MRNVHSTFIDYQYYFISQRGNNKHLVFRESLDRRQFLSKLEEYCERDSQAIIAYCLMDNHYHLALRQGQTRGISHTLNSLLKGYARFYNGRYGTTGPLFGERFHSELIVHPAHNPWHLARVTRYIHTNPAPFL